MPTKPETDAQTITRASNTLNIPGYVVDQEILEKIDGIAKELVAGAATKCTYEMRSSPPTSKGQVLSCKSLDLLLPRLRTEASFVESLSLRYASTESVGINIVFDSAGTVATKGFSHSPDLQFDLDRLAREIRECDQQYGWPVRTFVFLSTIKRIVRILLVVLSLLLLVNLVFYFYARKVGVNVDPSLIPPGETIATRVEEAIRSDDLSKKLNVLLMAHLRGFSNVRDILASQRTRIAWLSIALSIMVIGGLMLRLFARLYPRAFFRFGSQERAWSKLERRREVWGVVILIGFLVHIVAGVVIGFFAR